MASPATYNASFGRDPQSTATTDKQEESLDLLGGRGKLGILKGLYPPKHAFRDNRTCFFPKRTKILLS
jgi:hypothetical protein